MPPDTKIGYCNHMQFTHLGSPHTHSLYFVFAAMYACNSVTCRPSYAAAMLLNCYTDYYAAVIMLCCFFALPTIMFVFSVCVNVTLHTHSPYQ